MSIRLTALLVALLAPALVAAITWNPKPTVADNGFPYAPACTVSAVPTGTIYGTDSNRQITITAKTGNNGAVTGDNAQFIVEAYTNSPSCYPYATTPNCGVICTPWRSPFTKSASCTSVPHVYNYSMQLNPADLYTVPSPMWSVGTVSFVSNSNGEYVGKYFPERKDNYDISVMLLEQGGLFGLYYDNVWFLNTPSISRVDPTINFKWGLDAITTFGADYVAIRWTGKVRPDYTEPYTFYVNADEGVRLWIDKVLILDSWNAVSNETFGTVLLTANFYHDIILEYKELTGNAYCTLSWSSYTVPKQVIASGNLYTATHVQGSPFMNITIGAGDPAESTTTVAWGAGLTPSKNPGYGVVAANVVGVPQYFNVQAFDIFGNVQDGPSTASSWTFTVTPLQTSNAPVSTFAYNNLIGNATYLANYTVTTAGMYSLAVKVGSAHIVGSPWTIYSAPAATYSPLSVMWGRGLTYAMAASASQITILARDVFNNNRTMSTDFVQLTFTGLSNAPNGYVSYGVDALANNGYYNVMYTPQQSGNYTVRVMLNGVDIIGSPFMLVVVPAVAWGPTSFCSSSTNATKNATTLAPSYITLSSRDIYNNVVTLGNANIVGTGFLLSPTTASPLVQFLPIYFNVSVNDNNDGTYTLSYTAFVAGTYALSIKMNGQDVMNSPFTLVINPNVPAVSTSVTTGSGLSQGVTGNVYNIYVQARDAAANNQLDTQVGTALSTFTVSLYCNNPVHPAPTQVTIDVPTSNVTYVGNATFMFQYTPSLAYLSCEVRVRLYGTSHVPGSPFAVTILPGPALATKCTLDGAALGGSTTGVPVSFTMTSYDQYGNLIAIGGVPLFYNISQPYLGLTNLNLSTSQTLASWAAYNNPIPFASQSMVDLGTGKYVSTYTVNVAGNYSLNIFMPSQGGLRGAYYSSDYFAGSSLYAWRIDSAVNFDWGYNSPFLTVPSTAQTNAVFPADMFSVVWSGKLQAPTSEVTRFYVDLCANVGALLQLNGQTVINALNPLLGSSEPFGDILLTAGQMYDVLLFFKAEVGNASIVLQWSTPTRVKSIVPSSALYHIDQFGGAPFPITIWPNVVVASTTTVITNPLPKFIAGVPTLITIQARDLYGNNLWNSTSETAALFTATFTGVPSSATVNPTITPMALGVYNISWTPPSTGMQVLNIMYNGVSIGGMPQYVNVQSGMTVASKCTLIPSTTIAVTMSSTTSTYCSSLTNTTAGVWTQFTIQARDIFSNTRGIGGDQFTAVLNGIASTTTANINCNGIVRDNGDSTYNVTYRCPTSGNYNLNIYLNNTQLVAASPYSIYVSPAVPYANTTKVTTPATNKMATGVALGALSTTVTMYDQFGNTHTGGGNNLIVKCTNNYNGADGLYPTVVRGAVTDNSDGTYTISWTPATAATQWQCFVLVVDGQNFNQPNGLLANYYNNRWLQAPSVLTRIDPFLNFQWGTDLITPTAADYVSVMWTGFVSITSAGQYTFYVNADDSVRLYVNNVLIIDTWKLSAPGEMSATYTFPTANMLYDITVLYRQNTGNAFINLSWAYAAVAKQIIPMKMLFSGATNIVNSPFIVNVN